jgi:hypothetical protein
MSGLVMYVVMVALTPKCYDVKMAEYTACEVAQKGSQYRLVCSKPQEIEMVSLFVGKPRIDLVQDADPTCFTVQAVELGKFKGKAVSVTEWNKKATPSAKNINLSR